MKFLIDNAMELIMLNGIIFVSIGLFLVSPVVGFIGTGLIFWGLAYLIKIGGG